MSGGDEDIRAKVQAAKASLAVSADPLRLRGSKRERRRESDRRVSFTRDAGGSLPYLRRKGTIDDCQLAAGLKLREYALLAMGGMQAMDWLRERVDGGGAGNGQELGRAGVLDAERALRRVLRESGMGHDAAEVVLRVCCFDETLTSVACDFEADPQARANGGCDRMTRERVKGFLQSGLTCAYAVLFPANRMSERHGRAALRAWLAEDARPSDRPEIRDSEPRFAKGA